MTEIPMFNRTKGVFKPPRYRCFFLIDGVPGTRCYRSIKSVKKLEKRQGITSFQYVLLS